MNLGICEDEYFKLKPTQRNTYILNYMNSLLSERGYLGKLKIQPAENVYQTHGQRYLPAQNGIPVYAPHMWEFNRLSFEYLEKEVNTAITNALAHYHL